MTRSLSNVADQGGCLAVYSRRMSPMARMLKLCSRLMAMVWRSSDLAELVAVLLVLVHWVGRDSLAGHVVDLRYMLKV